MHPVSHMNTQHDVTDLVNHGWLKIQKHLCILRSSCFVAEVTFKWLLRCAFRRRLCCMDCTKTMT